MDETLKVARHLQWVFVAVCFLNLFFSVPAFQLARYNQPVQQLGRLIQLDLEDFRRFQLGKVSAFHDQTDWKMALSSLLTEHSVDRSLDFWIRMADTVPVEVHSRWPQNVLSEKATLAQINDFVTKAWSANAITFLIDANDVSTKINKLITTSHIKCVSDIDFRGQTSFYSTHPYATAIEGDLSWPAECGPAPTSARFQAKGKKAAVAGSSFKDWIAEERSEYAGIFQPASDGISFAHLRLIWPEIVNLDRANAFAVVQAQLRMANAVISAFGFAIPLSIMLFVGPSVACTILLYLLAHVRQLRSSSVDANAQYIWFALSSDIYARALTLASFILLPAASFTVSLIAFFDAGGSWWFGLILFLLAIGIGGLVCRELRMTRRV